MNVRSSTELLLWVNEIQPAFGIELGSTSPRSDEARAADPYRQANLSYLLVQRRGGDVVHPMLNLGRLHGRLQWIAETSIPALYP